MTTIESRMQRGARAREVLENEEFIAAFSEIEQELTEGWKSSPARDQEGRERIWAALSMLRKVRDCLQRTMETGKLASLELEHKRTMLERVRGIVS